ncbi:MAG: insulinase family protein, partial [Chlamydiia bacterium]|nr:insulinase family protein [Chlamydiia bacterium]
MKRFLIIIMITVWGSAESTQSFIEVQDQSPLQILTPSLSERKTAKIRLNNGLEAYLISDPKADQSAAALSMEAGSWNDDPRYAGIAHFLEHLLFMGSEAYPEENAYDKQIWDNGGTLNAYTASDRTVYIFSINHSAFPTALDMFGHMFSDPLFNPSGIGRELHAVDQEHDKNIESDGHRIWMVLKETGNPHHPNALFGTGNAETLGGIPQEEVKRWHRENYSADRAHLVLYSALPIEELKAMTVSHFASIPKGNRPKPVREKLFSEKQEGHIIAIKPIKEMRSLSLIWELPKEYVSNLECRSHDLLGYVLSGRHQNSLYTQLKKEELVEQVSSNLIRTSRDSGIFNISFDLTPLGAEQFETVIERCFQTLNGFKANGIPPYIFNEMKTMAKINYEYQSRETPYQFVSTHADNMIDEPLETYPSKTVMPTTYNPQEINHFLNLLSPESAAYFLIASPELSGIDPDKKERWSNVEYAIRKIPTKSLVAWGDLPSHPHIALPKQNPFIPSNLKLVHSEGEGEIMVTPRPKKLISSDFGTLYFWGDTQYQVPEISWIFNISTPFIDGTARHSVLQDLFQYTLDEKIADYLTYAEAASLSFKCRVHDMKLLFMINGYSEKAPLLLQKVLAEAKKCRMTREEFDLYTTSLKSSYSNMGKAMPVFQAQEITMNLLFNNAPKHTEKLAALKTITYEDYLSFADKLFSETYIETLLTGNMTEKEAHQIGESVKEIFHSTPYLKKNQERKQMLTLSSFQGPYKVPVQTESLGNAAILVIQEGAMTFPKKASHVILGTALQEDFFDTLRTKQQTAYFARASSQEEEQQLFNLFMVQSTSHQPDELISRFELFLETYIKDFESTLSEGRFEVLRNNLITLLDTPPTNLQQMAQHLNHLAFTHKGDFDRREKLIAALKKLDYEEFKSDTISFLSRKNPRRIAIMLEG